MNDYLRTFFPIFFIVMWFFALFMISLFNGWNALAQKYTCDGEIADNWKGWQGGYIGWAHYKGCLWIATTPRGLCLKTGPFVFFRPFHPPLCIPWEAIDSVKERKFWWVRFYDFRTSNPDVKISIPASAVEEGRSFYAQKLTLSQQN
jgi:hypothetical protein